MTSIQEASSVLLHSKDLSKLNHFPGMTCHSWITIFFLRYQMLHKGKKLFGNFRPSLQTSRNLVFADQAQFLQHYMQLPSVMLKTEFLGT